MVREGLVPKDLETVAQVYENLDMEKFWQASERVQMEPMISAALFVTDEIGGWLIETPNTSKLFTNPEYEDNIGGPIYGSNRITSISF